jgi:formate hydrogenlyase subunit 4
MNGIWIALITVVATPLVGGLLRGIDRKLTARMQGRIGPPIIQPFYDFFKLISKEKIITNNIQMVWPIGYLGMVIASLILLVLGQDLLMLVFVLGFGGCCLALGSFSSRSPYSQLGGNRELLQMLTYEPILILVAVAIYFKTDSFLIQDIFDLDTALLTYLPLAFIALGIAFIVKLRKSPFDISASEHAHQELVRGIYTEYSGPYLALIELAHWYELVLLLGLVALFWATPLWIGALIALAGFFGAMIVDNITARLTWSSMLKTGLAVGFGLVAINIAFLELS